MRHTCFVLCFGHNPIGLHKYIKMVYEFGCLFRQATFDVDFKPLHLKRLSQLSYIFTQPITAINKRFGFASFCWRLDLDSDIVCMSLSLVLI